MSPKEEIFCVRFNKAILKDGDIHFTSYTLGLPAPLSLLIPISIILKDKKITVTFNNKTRHVFHYSDDVELFYKEIEEKKEEDAGVKTDTKPKATRRRKATD